jgi:MFS transporter, DHA3 family, macrolide efflux protein
MRFPAQNPGPRTFMVIWLGQLVSIIGSGLTAFALDVWVYQRTGSVTQFALLGLFLGLPYIFLSPITGALVDRWDRRWAMIVSDTGSGLCTLVLALLSFTNQLDVWQVYVIGLAISTFGTLQWPAFSALTTVLVPQQHLGRANGLIEFGWAASRSAAPLLAGALLLAVPLHALIVVDAATFLFAVSTLLLVRIPWPAAAEHSEEAQGSFARDVAFGWRYITARPGLLGLLFWFAAINFCVGGFRALVTPLVLSFASAQELGVVVSVGTSGLLAGSVAMSLWGGPKRRIHGVLGFGLVFGVSIMLSGIYAAAMFVAAASFCYFLTHPIINGSDQAIWQTRVAPELQGRVFGTRRAIEWATGPLAFLVLGPLADGVFTPLLMPGGLLAASVGQVLGVGPGRGIALLLLLMGALPILASLIGYLYRPLRRVEIDSGAGRSAPAEFHPADSGPDLVTEPA